jgi:formyl-CoA transferase
VALSITTLDEDLRRIMEPRASTPERRLEAVARLNDAGVPAGPIYKMDEMFADPQVKHLKMAHPVKSPKLGDIELIGQAINMNRTPFEMRSATPEQGVHTEEVLNEFGYDAAAIADFRKRGVI